MRHSTRSPAVRPPRLYPVRDIPRQRRAEHVDCEDDSCGVCDQCLYVQAAYRTDHPDTISVRELAHL